MLNDLRRLFELIENKKYSFFIIFLFFLSSVLDLIGIGLIGPYISLFLNETSEASLYIKNYITLRTSIVDPIVFLALLILIIFFIKIFIVYLINSLVVSFGNKEMVNMRLFLLKKYQMFTLSDFQKSNKSEYMYNMLALTTGYSKLIISIFKTIGDFIVALLIILFLSTQNFIVLLTILLILVLLFYIYDKKFRSKLSLFGESMNSLSSNLFQLVSETLLGFKEIRLLGKENFFLKKIKNSSNKWSEYAKKSILIEIMPKYLIEFIFIFFVIIFTLILIVMQSDLNEFLPLLATFTVASLRLFPISNSFLSNIVTIRANKNSIDRLHQVKKSLIDVRLKKDEKDFNNIEFEKFKNLKISNLYFRYNKENRYIFKNLNLTFESEKVVGIFGESGSGKSTLVDLITGILIPDSGYIKINDKDLNENLILIKKLTSYMPQQIFLIDGTIQENIALGEDKENINNEKLFGSIKKAELDNLINDLPEGIHTKIGDNGIRLSGGQRQRIGLARSFYFEKQILILDEATNALDELIERSILDNIIKNKKNSLIIIISHNKETLKECDEIYEIIDDNIKLKFKK
tara:strand:- start:3650 stop:5377 length:1728 start_codon:yes stop_codon:yes gene_type:complete